MQNKQVKQRFKLTSKIKRRMVSIVFIAFGRGNIINKLLRAMSVVNQKN